jgi:serpin B
MHLFAEATTKFTLELYRQLRESDNNIFYSPISMMTALAMLQLGAKGNTEKQIEKVGLSFVLLTSLNFSP